MFRIVDGRDSFYQWDLDRQIAVEDNSIVEVHFCNRTDDCSLVVEVVDGIANVPNILLQSSFDVRVFGYDGKATLHDKVFKVKPRTRPADYVYTETEVLSIEKLSEDLRKEIDERLTAVEEGLITDGFATMEYVDKAIEDNCNAYVLKNPGYLKTVTDQRTIEFLDFCWAGTFYPATVNGYSVYRYAKEPLQKDTLEIFFQVLKSYRILYEYSITFTRKSDGGWYGGTTPEHARNVFVNKTSELYNDAKFATEAYVDNAIANIEIPDGPGGETDLSDYYTKAETDGKIEEAVEAIDIPEVDLEDYYTKEEVDDYIDTVIYRMVKPSGTEPTKDPFDGTRLQITDAHTIEYLNRIFNGEAVLGYTWRVGLHSYLITDFVKSISRLTLKAHRLMGATITHYTFYMDIEDDGSWYWVGHHTEDYNIQKATEDAIQTAFDDVVTAEGGAY